MNIKEISNLINMSDKTILEIYSDIFQPGAKKVGLALETVIDLSNTILLPIKLLNEKTRATFERNIRRYEEKLDEIREDDITEVPSEIGIPLLDKLTYYRNEDLSILFINLLSTASSRITIQHAHPSFIKIIEELSVDEAIIINYISKLNRKIIPYIYLRANIKDENPEKDYIVDISKLTSLEVELELFFPKKINSYLNNLIKVGLFQAYDDTTDPDYKKEYIELRKNYQDYIERFHKEIMDIKKEFNKPQVLTGFYRLTSYGEEFIKACVK